MEIPQCITTGPRAKDESKEEKKWRKNAVKEERKVRNWFSQVTYGIKTQTCWTMKQKQQQKRSTHYQSRSFRAQTVLQEQLVLEHRPLLPEYQTCCTRTQTCCTTVSTCCFPILINLHVR